MHKKSKRSALEVIFTTLHAGGKFEHSTYRTAGGLHGVGASVVNALSKELVATSKRDGARWEQRFRQGQPVGSLRRVGGARGTGTTVFFRPDATIFPKTTFDTDLIAERLNVTSYLHKGVTIVFEDQTVGGTHVFLHEKGLADYLRQILDDRSATPVHDGPFTLTRTHEPTNSRLDLVLQWTESTDEHLRSYANGIPTGSGGTHENGLRAGIGKAIRNFIDMHGLTPKGVTLTTDDIREGITGVLSIFVPDPQFQGQTKDRLHNPELVSVIDGLVRPALEHWLNHNSSVAEVIIARIILAARARAASRAAHQAVSRKSATSNRLNLPGKAERLHRAGCNRERAVHRGGRLGRRLSQAGSRPGASGDPAAPREGAQCRKRATRQGAREQGALRPSHSTRLRARETLRAASAPLRQGHHPGRRRRRRQSHRRHCCSRSSTGISPR